MCPPRNDTPSTISLKPASARMSTADQTVNLPGPPAQAQNFAEFLPQSQALIERVKPGIELGRYRIGERIGIGGMGAVHRGTNLESREPVALKFLISSSQEKGERQVERFKQEAEIIRKLDHGAIVKVSEVISHDGLYFMAMELFLGPYDRPVNLSDYAARFGSADGMLDEVDTRSIMLVLLDAIRYAHRNRVVHCDLKPANILFQSLGLDGDYWRAHLKLTDFGVAKVVGEQVVRESVTQSINRLSAGESVNSDALALLGTYDYMSPEQRRGEAATAASDLYSIGLMIYRFLTGKSELGLRRPSELRQGMNAGWDAIILKALQERPDRRYQDAAELIADLEALDLK